MTTFFETCSTCTSVTATRHSLWQSHAADTPLLIKCCFLSHVQKSVCLVLVELNVCFVMFLIQKSEEMKKKGNENFKRQQYDDAVRFYSKAIKY